MLRKYKKGDIEKINVQPSQNRENREDWRLFENEDTLVFEDNGRILAIVLPLYEQGGRIFLTSVISADCKDKSILMFKKMKKIIDGWLESGEAERVEFLTQSNFEPANRLARLLGFIKEGTLRKYYNGLDFNIWGRIK